jgi:hypothetical protein
VLGAGAVRAKVREGGISLPSPRTLAPISPLVLIAPCPFSSRRHCQGELFLSQWCGYLSQQPGHRPKMETGSVLSRLRVPD